MLKKVSLDDKYALDKTRAFITGIEALVRLPMLQHQRDLAAGLSTAGFISGYRGSPLGGVDHSMWKAQKWLEQHDIHFHPGVNEDLAVTSVWGTQQIHSVPGPKYDGVFGMWYGKGPGVDRSMDAIKHANAFGTTQYGGVLAVAGDDHACKSSSTAHQSEHMFIGAGVPVLNPANVQEVMDYGLYGWALSRYSGCWVGLKAITEIMDSAMTVDIDANRVQICLPQDFAEPEGGLSTQWPTSYLDQERLLYKYRVPAAREFARVNKLNQIVVDSTRPRLGIATSGKSYVDVMEALDYLGIDKALADKIGIRVYKIGMNWPLEPEGTLKFASGLEEILVVEEKRNIIEDQMIKQLYHLPQANRPVVVGEFDESGRDLVSSLSELTTVMVAQAIGSRIAQFYESNAIKRRLADITAKQEKAAQAVELLTRKPYFCSGCPHNTSTRVPEGSVGMAGIGCHAMVKWMNRNTQAQTHMGGEGVTWVGMAPFTETKHVFQNLGDGTYFHSGTMAIRAAVASGVNITYKLLYNDAVAMTGGQPIDGTLSLLDVVLQLKAERVTRLAVVAENLETAAAMLKGVSGVTLHARKELNKLQLEFREVQGTSVIVYDQTCAVEKRRRRKRGTMPESATTVFINPEICEGCGDCSDKSNCLSVLPKKTEMGTKRQIDQSSCNKDLSCIEGFCPSFVTLTGASIRSTAGSAGDNFELILPDPDMPTLERPWNIQIAGIGGTGVLTIGAILAMAAHIEDKGCTTLNQTGLAQKFGSVFGHVKIARHQGDIHAVRIPQDGTDLLLGCDLVASAGSKSLARLSTQRSHSIVNSYESTTADFIHDLDYQFPAVQLQQTIRDNTSTGNTGFVNATRMAKSLLGNSIGSNMILLGYAYQKGLIPISADAINEAIRLNGVAVEFNQKAFTWGRRAAVNMDAVESLAAADSTDRFPLTDLDEIIDWRYRYLVKYQNTEYADRYRVLIDRVRKFETHLKPENFEIEPNRLSEAVARNYFKIMAYKDEYEVARLYSDGTFVKQLKEQFEGPFKLKIHLSPPLFAGTDAVTGHPFKYRFPEITLRVFGILARLKFLRGTSFDLFGRSPERKQERQLIEDYEKDIALIMELASQHNFSAAVAIAQLPDQIKGFGHIKAANIQKYLKARQDLIKKLREPELLLVVNQ